MLKIKDNVDLKELEKFGIYRTQIDTGTGRTVYQDELWWFPSGLMIDINSREILLHSGEYEKDKNTNKFIWTGKHTTILYDLIKADLVEKIGE